MATESVAKQVEESNMDTPKEIFLKDYKQPDYFFETVKFHTYLCFWIKRFLIFFVVSFLQAFP